MKKLGILFASVFLLGLVFQSCNNGKTYAEMKEEEREAIKRFIEREDINVISFEQFQEQDSTTNVDENQFVLFSETGVYMQIVAEGNGERLKDGRYEILARYVEEGGPGAPPFETQVDARALAARAKELLQTRRPPAGEVLWLRAQGYSFAEIAQRCGVSESAARTLDFRTRHWLREQLQKEGAEL